jgi:hypothetical protein
LYDERSRAAHGSPLKKKDAYQRSIELLRRTLVKMIEQRHVPTADELEKLLFEAGRLGEPYLSESIDLHFISALVHGRRDAEA